MLPSTIDITMKFEEDLPRVMTDPTQVHQIIMNLCINAQDAISDHGKIEIELSLVSEENTVCTSCQRAFSGEFVELTIKDTGEGIDSKHIHSLFEPFFTTKEMSKGTGMGLAIVHGIMHAHNGHIILNSEPGVGSTFRLLFPVIREELQINTMSKTTEKAREMLKLWPEIPIILCKGYNANMTEEIAKNMGIVAYLNKPISMVELNSIINQLFE